jgi:hypothetical protein
MKRLILFLGGIVVALAFSNPVRAGMITYTFSGVGNGTVDTTAWSGDFTFKFTADTANIFGPSGGEFFQFNLGGTFSEGSYSATLLADNIVVVNNDPNFPRLGFFNSAVDNGGVIQNSTFTTYDLSTSFGPITGTGSNLLPTFNPSGDGFGTTGGDTIEVLGMTSLTFTAATVPEPSTLVMWSFLCAMFCVVGLRKRMKKTTAAA